MEELITSSKLQVERKLFFFDLKQNYKGRFLKITEDVRGRRNTIIIPSTGLDEFKAVLNNILAIESELKPFVEEEFEQDEVEDQEEEE